MRSSNPLQRDSVYEKAFALSERPMTIAGTTNKLLILSVVMLLGAFISYYQFSLGHTDLVNLMMTGGVAVGFILAIVLAICETSRV